ncbi:MAG TPA: phosphoribosyltransferase, partial [Bdellovibrionota bacterium]|nr:phosphoribosyltransferase [Bdellovibrionota bacterium]
MKTIYRDRREAGEKLAAELQGLKDKKPVILALPRGGVPVAAEVAQALHAPLDVLVVRKIGMPGNRELGIGAIAEDDVLWIDSSAAAGLNIDPSELESELKHELIRVSRNVKKYRGERAPIDLEGRTAIIVDDGVATGVTTKAAAKLARARGAAEVIVAVPVGSRSACEFLAEDADRVICLSTPDPFFSVSGWYEDFTQVTDDQVLEALGRFAPHDPLPEILSRPIKLSAAGHQAPVLHGELRVPQWPSSRNQPVGAVIFAH